jgi:hypothetical protein
VKRIIEGMIQGRTEVTGGRGRSYKQLLDDLKDTRGYVKLKEETLNRPLWRKQYESVAKRKKKKKKSCCYRSSTFTQKNIKRQHTEFLSNYKEIRRHKT